MEYFLRDSGSSQTFTTSSMLTSSTPANCGPITVEFYNDNLSKSALDAELFNVDASVQPQSLSVLETQDLGKVGSYPIKYRAYHTNYPDNRVEVSQAFTVTVTDPCRSHIKSVTPSSLTDQSYTITGAALTYQVPEFTSDPAWCAITYEYSLSDEALASAISYDSNLRTFTFESSNDLTLSGDNFIDYTITITATAGIDTPVSDSASFNIQVKNPCIDESYVQINAPTLADQTYSLYSPSETFKLTASTTSTAHSLCGSISYSASFDEVAIDETSSPLTFTHST